MHDATVDDCLCGYRQVRDRARLQQVQHAMGDPPLDILRPAVKQPLDLLRLPL